MHARLIILPLVAIVAFASIALVTMRRPKEPAQPVAPAAVAPGEYKAGDRLPAPKGDVVLTIRTGRDVVELDLATLERLPRQELTVQEPFRKRPMRFSGVPLADLLTIAGVPAGHGVEMVALDDYHVALSAEEIRASRPLLATRAEGGRQAVKDGGPTRIVFPDGTTVGRNSDNWIWSIKTVEARP